MAMTTLVRQMGSSNTTFREVGHLYLSGRGTDLQEGTATDKTRSWVEQADEEE